MASSTERRQQLIPISDHGITSGLVEEAMLELREAGVSEAGIDTFKKMTRSILSTENDDDAFDSVSSRL